jgi:CheY-like chemotaxis protein
MNKKRVLLVDDEATFTKLIQRHLEGTGKFEVRTESKATQVMTTAREFRPDVIVLDVIMPDQDGGEVAAELKTDPKLGRVPVIFLTAIVSKEHVQRQGEVIGGQTFLAKPVSVPDLVRHIEAKLDQAA